MRTGQRAALVVAHPGHELLVYGWLGLARPVACVLTDGSGLGRPVRLEKTRRLLLDRHASPGPVFGRWADREIYDALLDGKTEPFLTVLHELADFLAAGATDYVVGDAAEGFNPSHDLCRLLIDGAAALAARRLGRPVDRYEFPQYLHARAREAPEGSLRIDLDDETFAAKESATRAYSELAHEVQVLTARFTSEAFRQELLTPSLAAPGAYELPEDPPVYERYGEALAAQGRVERVIRYREHMRPLAEALGREVARSG